MGGRILEVQHVGLQFLIEKTLPPYGMGQSGRPAGLSQHLPHQSSARKSAGPRPLCANSGHWNLAPDAPLGPRGSCQAASVFQRRSGALGYGQFDGWVATAAERPRGGQARKRENPLKQSLSLYERYVRNNLKPAG
jgi:hypothetical protein